MSDPSTLSNFAAVSTTHLHWAAAVDFESKKLACTATLTLERLDAAATEVVLDTNKMVISEVLVNGMRYF